MSSPTTATPSLKIRPATIAASDHELLVDFQESQISWLSSIGSAAQWGTKPPREKDPSITSKTRVWIEKSEKCSPWSSGDWCRAFVAETGDGIPVAGLVLEDKAPKYVGDVLPERDESDEFVYLAYLISNRDAGEVRKGAAGELIELAKEEVRKAGINRICLDCFRGNNRKLVRYYESQGFKPIADFTAGEQNWEGCVLEMRL